MLILYIAVGAFILGGGIFIVAEYTPERGSRKWY